MYNAARKEGGLRKLHEAKEQKTGLHGVWEPPVPQMYDVAIIGGGPAGVAAAIYSFRRGMKTVVFEDKAIGGVINDATVVEDWPGIARITGGELGKKFEEHLTSIQGIDLKREFIEKIEKKNDGFSLYSMNGTHYSKTLIIATGCRYKGLGLEKEKNLLGKGLGYCILCDMTELKGKKVAVVGGGNAALNAALHLVGAASKIYLIHRRSEFRADELVQKRVLDEAEKGNITLLLSRNVVDLIGNNKVEGCVLEEVETKKRETLELGGLYLYAGNIPSSSIAGQIGVKTNELGFIQADEEMRTNVEGVFAAGDVTGKKLVLVAAVSQGAIAAMNACNLIKYGK
ncbi:FAD-dependent oxidoreductase [Candidatus Micrarchaeota archaeon]|nr:FAD-dependent oxidoreductase [Candidatus Micrarchaeota archaeon]